MSPNTAKMRSIWYIAILYGLVLLSGFAVLYFFLGKESLSTKYWVEPGAGCETNSVVGELTKGSRVEQSFALHADSLRGITIRFATFDRPAKGKILLQCRDEQQKVLAEALVDASLLEDNADYYFNFSEKMPIIFGDIVTLVIQVLEGEPGSSVTLWSGEKQTGWELTVNNSESNSTLYLIPDAYILQNYAQIYWLGFLVIVIAWLAFCLKGRYDEVNGNKTPANEIIHIFDRYRFLLTQLVARDFKNKYRRSYLGILWSLLNPLLMMVIVSAVFSFVFRFNINHFQVYLILGQVTFSFFSEATQVAVTTVVGSGQLIKKVYLPKYIFTLGKTTFSFINTVISFIAVFAVMLYYRVSLTMNVLFLPYFFVTYYLFVLGVGLVLSAMNVFLRDTQYLYGLVVTALGYLTPIFYPVDSLSPWMQSLIKLNPLYHFVTYLRTILLYGQAPSLNQGAVCAILAVSSLVIGIRFFFKRQGKFILYI